MTDETITPIAPIAQVFHQNPDVQTLLTFAICEREHHDAWLMIDALRSLGLITIEQAWRIMSERMLREFD
jgi:hypothetical protein